MFARKVCDIPLLWGAEKYASKRERTENEEYTTFFPPHTLSCQPLDRCVSTRVHLVSARGSMNFIAQGNRLQPQVANIYRRCLRTHALEPSTKENTVPCRWWTWGPFSGGFVLRILFSVLPTVAAAAPGIYVVQSAQHEHRSNRYIALVG